LHRDAPCVQHRLAVLGKERQHLRRALHVDILGVLQPVRIVLVLLHRDAAERVVDIVVLGVQEVRVVVDDKRQPELLRELAQIRIDLLLLGHMALQLDVEARLALVVGLERGGVPPRLGDGALPEDGILARAQVVLEVRRERRAEVAVDRDDAVGPLREGRLVHARLVVEAVQERVRRELEEVAVARDRLGEQHEVPAAVLLAGVGLVAAVALLAVAVDGDVGLDPEDRLDAELLRLQVELHRPEHVAVVGDRDGVHAEFLHALEQALDAVAAVEQRVLGVEVQMSEHRFARRGGSRSVSHRSRPRERRSLREMPAIQTPPSRGGITRTFSRPSSARAARGAAAAPKILRTSHMAIPNATSTAAHPRNTARSTTPSASRRSATGTASTNVSTATTARSKGPAFGRTCHGGRTRNRCAASRPMVKTRKVGPFTQATSRAWRA
jgi:hypothetical protein